MREIKFRVALMGYKKLFKVTKIEDDEDFGRMISCENDEDEIQDYYHYDYTLMQYTGLLDKNGVDIYEGDIILWINSDGEEVKDKVLFFNGAFRMRNMAFALYDYSDSSIFEVIGNIYENRELLE